MLEARLNRATWIVKGGVNLRAWYGSRRYSEDLDLDAVGSAPHVLRERFDKILLGPALGDLLTSQGLEVVRMSKPKQTDTTQRWKLELKSAGVSLPLHTKVEFSRRGTHGEESAFEPARSAIRQKIHALAGRAETQARDVWDLDHLLRSTGADPRPLSYSLLEKQPATT